LEQKAPGRVEKVKAAYTSQTCNACKHIASESRQEPSDLRVCFLRVQGERRRERGQKYRGRTCRDSTWRPQSFGSVCEA
jgi:hypothetical protein